MLDKSLGDVVVFFFAIPPSFLLTHVAIVSVPLVNAIKHLLSGHKNSANSALLQASEYCARHVGSRNNNILKDILLDVLGTIVVGFSKLGNTLPFRTRVHKLNIDTHMPILEGIDDIVNVLLGPAHCNTCRGSGERDIAEAVVRGTSAARVLTENALFMNSWWCFSMSSAAFSAMK
jgi:hypothetical protein